VKALLDLVRRHKAGRSEGLHSVCSGHPVVIEAALAEGQRRSMPVLIEATSNQVNPFGGYTGMKPADFHRFVMDIADRMAFPRDAVLLGGDHLGPNCWRSEAAEPAMVKSELMIEQYVQAGFRKIHLDCSMSCAGDATPLPEAIVAARATRLCAAAEQAWQHAGGEAPVYIIGTEVPVPGGAQEDLTELSATQPEAAASTIDVHRAAFAAAGLEAAWARVIGLVVQPGVEFDHHKVIDYDAAKAEHLSRFITTEPGLVYEAHSTDYQTPANLKSLVRDHFAILKVGPGVTYALRETLWALADIEREWLGPQHSADLKNVVLGVMRAQPAHWQTYYSDPAHRQVDLQFSLSDRIRYYWPHPDVQRACRAMLANLDREPPPLTLLSQHLPHQYAAIREGRLGRSTAELLREGVARTLRHYIDACTPGAGIAAAESTP
jgi:D-tagatose-1,6-bisphosphate aldolase subunit GatZ/KbaZ